MKGTSVAFWLKSYLGPSEHCGHRFLFDLLFQVSATQLSLFLCIPSVFMANAEEAVRTSLPGSSLDLERTGNPLQHMRDNVNEMSLQLAQMPLFLQSVSRFENCVHMLSQSMAAIRTKVTNMQQVVGGLAARVAALEASAVSASSVSGSLSGSCPLPGEIDGSTATGCRDPGSSEEGRNTRCRLDKDTSPDDENALSAVLLRFPCEQCLPGMHAWFKKDT